MVDNAEQARHVVAATRIPPRGIRGVASATSRASGFGANTDYLASAHEMVCLFVQIESQSGLDNIDAIAATEGVDGLFIGPADLAASLGQLGNPRHPAVQDAIARALAAINAAGKVAGIFALDADDARARIADGFRFVSLGTDIGLLRSSASGLVNGFRDEAR
jgi:4-hydroxy-2-oxoheptanedioate aldolase